MEKRVLLAVVLSFIVLYGYQALFPPPKPAPAAPGTPQATPSTPPGSPGQPAPSVTPSAPVEAPAPAAAPLVADAAERDIVVESDAVHATFTTRGGVLKSWRLKRYHDGQGHPLELVPQKVPDATDKPFSLKVDDAATSATLGQALFKPSADRVTIGAQVATLTFEYRDQSGLSASKTFTFNPERPYVIEFTPTVSRNDEGMNPTIAWGPALGTGIVGGGMNYAPAPQPIFYRDGKVTRVGFGDVPASRVQEGVIGFAGVDDHYFLSAVVAAAQPLRAEFQPHVVPVEGGDSGLQFVSWSVRFQTPQPSARFFFGPKDFDVLASIDRDLVRAIDFGIFSWLVVPLLRSLKWVNGYVGNYGWSIIILTVLINLVMFPLRHKSVVSMRKMTELQPEIKAIQERYAKLKMNDPARQKMNVEMMNLYRERGVNPASGCVPMLLTMPVLFAFYSMLSVAIELRGAPFIWWIKDLATYDPLYVTPVLMGATMVIQQKMTPSTADPVQQKMMMIMPLVFTGMFVIAPSGLVLYWTVSNLWTIGQQALTNKLIGPTTQRVVRPPAERRVKNAGAGKTSQASKDSKERK